MKRRILVIVLALVMVLTVAACVACQETTYTLTYAAGEGSGTAPASEQLKEGAEITLKAADTFTAPAGKEFDGWLVDGAKKAAGEKITMPAKDLTITAQWKTSEPQMEHPVTLYYYNEDGWTDVKAYAFDVDDNLLLGAWPGTATTAVAGHDKWVQITMDADLDVLVDVQVVFNGSGKQTKDLLIEDAEHVYFAKNGGYTSIEEAEAGSLVPPETLTVYYYNSEEWDEVYAYVFLGDPLGSWPGTEMTAVDGHDNWYEIEIDEDLFDGSKNIIFTNNSGAQTANLPIEDSTNLYYIYVEKDASVVEDYAYASFAAAEEALQPTTVTVTFKNGDEVVSTVTLEPGAAIAATDIPEDPECDEDETFRGWYNGETRLQIGAEITASVTYTAKFESNSWIVSFVNGESTITRKVAKDGNGLVSDVPSDPELAPSGKIFLGWYNGTDKYTTTTVINADITYTAAFAGASDYVGAWYNDEAAIYVIVHEDNSVVINWRSNPRDGEFNLETGTYVITTNIGVVDETTTLTAINGKLKVVAAYYETTQGHVVNEYVLDKAAAIDFAYNYKRNDYSGASSQNQSGSLNVNVGGIVTNYYGHVYYARVISDGENYSILCQVNENSQQETIPMTIDSLGSIVITQATDANYNGLYVKSSSVYRYDNYILGTGTYILYDHTITGEQSTSHVYVYLDIDGVYSYATLSGELVVNSTLTLTVNGEDMLIKVIDDESSHGRFAFPGAEAGTYTCEGKADIVLNGFGTATIGEDKYTYTLVDADLTIGSKVYVIDVENKTYTEKEYIGYKGSYINEQPNQFNQIVYYEMVIDGYGNIKFGYQTNSRPTSFSYVGTYTVEGNKIVVTGTSIYNYDGKFAIEEDGNVLVFSEPDYSTSSKKNWVFILDGAQITSRFDEFVGSWADSDESNTLVVSENKTVKFNGTAVNCTVNYNGSVLTFEAACDSDISGSVTYTATLSADGETVVISAEACTGYDSIYEEYTYEDITITLTASEEEQTVLDGWQGKYEQGTNVLIINGDTTATYNGNNVIYSINGETITFTDNYTPCTATKTDNGLSIFFDDSDYPYTLQFTKTGEIGGTTEPELDDFAGTWTGKVGANNYTVVCDGQGNIDINGTKGTYAAGSTTISVGVFTVTMNANGTMHVVFDDGDYYASGDLTKQS